VDRLTVELRESGGEFRGVILQEGRASSDRRELFTPGATAWPASGIRILAGHRGAVLATAVPERGAGGEITVTAPATPQLREAVRSRPHMSVEFHAIRESRTASGIREVERAFVDAAALVASPSYPQTSAEVRSGGHRKAIWGGLLTG